MTRFVAAFLLCLGLCACTERGVRGPLPPDPSAGAGAAAGPVPGGPRAGAHKVAVRASGTGTSMTAAIDDALRAAVLQANGATLDQVEGWIRFRAQGQAALDAPGAGATAALSVHGEAYAAQMQRASGGAVSALRVLSSRQSAGVTPLVHVEIEAQVLTHAPDPVAMSKLRIVVSPLRARQAIYQLAGRPVAADALLDGVRRTVVDALAQSGRFTILDRDPGGALAAELALIDSGQAARAEAVKKGQALAADLVWSAELVALSHTGGAPASAPRWAVAQRLVDLATRQVVYSATLHSDSGAHAASSPGGNDQALVEGKIGRRAAEAILLHVHPATVLERTGASVVLSQGAGALREGQRYRVFRQMRELHDPGSGISLGHTEESCCILRVDRVASHLSYGVLENVTIRLDHAPLSSLLVRESLPPLVAPVASAVARTAPRKRPATVALPLPGGPRESDW